MDYFENLIMTLLQTEGYWVRQSFKVGLIKQEKAQIGRHSIPRPEIDLLAFRPSDNELLVIEVKSYLDSPGVKLADLMIKCSEPTGRYKLFTCDIYRATVLGRLKEDLISLGMINEGTKITLGLAAGKVYQNRSEELRKFMYSNGWFCWAPEDIRQKVIALAAMGYENDPAIITAKILMRK